jgi:chromosome segregation ATPase
MNNSVAQLQKERAELETECDTIVSAIRDLRQRAREKTIVAQDTRQSLAQSEIDYWQRGIAEHQTRLMNVQGKLGALNKRLREQHVNNNGAKQQSCAEE